LEQLVYAYDIDRWTIVSDQSTWELHCGDSFWLKVDEHWLPCRIENDTDWYIIFANAQFYLKPKRSYLVKP